MTNHASTPEPHYRSTLPGAAWPAVPDSAGALMLALQFELEQTQWWTPEAIERAQLRQLGGVLQHAHATIPFWRARLESSGFRPGMDLTGNWFRSLPLLLRSDVQAQGDTLLSSAIPATHGTIGMGQTSGSTGKPITFYTTELAQTFWRACTLRDHLWHQRDFAGTLAAIRIRVDRKKGQGWGPATDSAFHTGPFVTLNIRTDIDEQLQWLDEHDPQYLITHPSNLKALVLRSQEKSWRPKKLLQARTFAEALPDDLRGLCREVWNVPLCDLYSAEETGYIALQCPAHDHYHAQSENLILEILNERGESCAPGERGRLVVTTLNNFAMPLVRYEIGDHAIAGAPCPCGRGLKVIEKILGRTRNLLRLPDGRRFYPSFPADSWIGIAPITQLQVVQRTLEDIEIRLVAARSLSPDEEASLTAAFRESLTYPFRITLQYRDEIRRSGNCKFEDFISELES